MKVKCVRDGERRREMDREKEGGKRGENEKYERGVRETERREIAFLLSAVAH